MTEPTADEIEARAKADYDWHCADLLARWSGEGKDVSPADIAEWNIPADWQDPRYIDGYWDSWRAAAREALIREREDVEKRQ